MTKSIQFRVGISFDGEKDLHDKIRGISGIHESALTTVKSLRNIADPRLKVQANVTVTPYNVYDLDHLNDYLKKHVEKIAWFPVNLSEFYFKNTENGEDLLFDEKGKKQFIRFLNHLIAKEKPSPSIYYYSKLIHFLNNGCRDFPCTGGFRYMHIDYNGNVKPCPFLPENFIFGNVREKSLSDLSFADHSIRIRKNLMKYSMCKQCSSDCDLYSLVRYEFFNYLGFVIKKPGVFKRIVDSYILSRASMGNVGK